MRAFAVVAALCSFAVAARAEPTFEEINTACGVPLFADDNLWDDDAQAVAGRLALPLESLTSTESSYRSYPPADARFLGARPHSQSLLAAEGKPVSLSFVFANKGDSVTAVAGRVDNSAVRGRRKELRAYREAIELDEASLRTALTAVLGEPEESKFGQGRDMRERVLRWNWKDHAFLLAAPRGEYVLLRIVPAAVAESGGVTRVPDNVMRERLASRVERRPNGDVVLRDMPMVDQGPKGYCVPATWERAMRYTGIPADMYVLAMAAGTGEGGGTAVDDISWAARGAIMRAGRRVESAAIKLTPKGVAQFIDEGLPIMWAMFSTDQFNALADQRLRERKEMPDPESWSASLEGPRKAAKKMQRDRDSGHVCMIIGYNETTGELAISDSWGPEFAERWITAEEAEAVSQGDFYVIRP